MRTATRVSALLQPRWLLVAILLIEGLVATFEASLVWQCQHVGGECWPFFISFLLNLPFSIPLSDLIAALPQLLSIDPDGDARTIATACIYALGGTLWWGGLVVALRAVATGALRSAPRSGGDV
jgi:hypothetical protein